MQIAKKVSCKTLYLRYTCPEITDPELIEATTSVENGALRGL